MAKRNTEMNSNAFGIYPNSTIHPYVFDKAAIVRDLVTYMLDACQTMVEYEGMPDTIPQSAFRRIIQTGGFAILSVPDVLGYPFAFEGGIGGEDNGYYLPTLATVANPWVKYTKDGVETQGVSRNFHDGKDCVIVPHDSQYMGLLPTIKRQCTLIAETIMSLRLSLIRDRAGFILAAKNDAQAASIDRYFGQLEEGKLGSIAGSEFAGSPESLPIADSTGGGASRSLLEVYQYLDSRLWMSLGVSAQWNAKRESLNETESASGDDILTPFTDDIIRTQNEAFERYEALTGIHIRAKLGGVWARIKDDSEVTVEDMTEGSTEEEKPSTEDEGGEDHAKTD